MWRLNSDNPVFTYVKGLLKKPRLMVLAALTLLICIALASAGGVEETESPEQKLSALCSSVDGVGRCQVTLVYGNEGQVSAAAVVCEGAENVEVRAELYDMLSALLGIGTNRIAILKFNE